MSPKAAAELELGRLAGRGVALGAGSLVLSFPIWWTAGFVGAAVLGEILHGMRLLRRVFWTTVGAAFCAQATSLFVTPFTWPLRAGFFFVLIGAVVAFWATQTDE